MTKSGEVRSPEPADDYYYRRPVRGRALLPAVGVGIAVGLAAFYVARLFLQRTPLRPEGRPRAARLDPTPSARSRGGR